jgi:hypothetical protein
VEFVVVASKTKVAPPATVPGLVVMAMLSGLELPPQLLRVIRISAAHTALRTCRIQPPAEM